MLHSIQGLAKRLELGAALERLEIVFRQFFPLFVGRKDTAAATARAAASFGSRLHHRQARSHIGVRRGGLASQRDSDAGRPPAQPRRDNGGATPCADTS